MTTTEGGVTCATATTKQKVLPVYTLKQISEHKSDDDCWVAVDNRVYNITNWLSRHPGGKSILFNFAGTDCSDEFRTFHYKPNYKLLNSFCVGTLHQDDCREETVLSKDLQELHQRIKLEGAFLPDCKYSGLLSIICRLFEILLLLNANIHLVKFTRLELKFLDSVSYLQFKELFITFRVVVKKTID